jgi:carbonic anhydrase
MLETFVDLLAGNDAHADAFDDRFGDVQDGQRPDAVTVCCSDSRVLGDHLWGNDTPGRLFSCDTIGNRTIQRRDGDTFVAGDVLYPLVETGTELAVVVGHTGCGAVGATYDAITGDLDAPPGIEYCVDLLRPALDDGVDDLPDDLDRAGAVNHLVEYNVDRQVDALVESEDVPDGVTVAGVVYDFQDVYGGRRGEVHVINLGGDRDPGRVEAAHPALADRASRLWTY